MPSLFQLLVIAGVALVVLVLWRYLRAPAARTKNASMPTGKRYERRRRQRRVRRERRSTVRLEAERRQGRGRRPDDQLG
ncbi:MAG: hypothetical protein ACE5H7_14665 [Acidiferrobacterales bacterium]